MKHHFAIILKVAEATDAEEIHGALWDYFPHLPQEAITVVQVPVGMPDEEWEPGMCPCMEAKYIGQVWVCKSCKRPITDLSRPTPGIPTQEAREWTLVRDIEIGCVNLMEKGERPEDMPEGAEIIKVREVLPTPPALPETGIAQALKEAYIEGLNAPRFKFNDEVMWERSKARVALQGPEGGVGK